MLSRQTEDAVGAGFVTESFDYVECNPLVDVEDVWAIIALSCISPESVSLQSIRRYQVAREMPDLVSIGSRLGGKR